MMLKLHIKWRDGFFLSIGAICATVANNWSFFTFDKNISVTDLFTAAIGGYIGLYVGSKLTSKVSSDRVEKDIIIAEINATRGFIARVHTFIDSNNLSLSDAVSLFKTASQSLSLAKEMVQICNNNKNLISEITTVLGKVRDLNRVVTRISPINGILNIPETNIIQLLTLTRSLNKSLFNLIILVNRDID